MDEAPGPGWWLASDGRYYPPESRPGTAPAVATAIPPAPPSEPPRPPVYRRAWFWVVIGVAVLLVVGVSVALVVGLLLTPSGTSETSDQSGRSDAAGLVPLASTDYSAEPDGPAESGEGWSSEVSDGILLLSPDVPGATYPRWIESTPTDEMKVVATLGWPDASAPSDGLYVAGVIVVGAEGEGYGLACGSDGEVYVFLVGSDRTESLESSEDDACLDDEFTLSLDVTRGDTTDILSMQFPGGENTVTMPGQVRGPFTEAGFMTAAPSETVLAPDLAVSGYEVWVAE